MKKLIATLLSCTLLAGSAVGLAACGGDDGPKETETERTVTVWLHKSKTEDEGKTYGNLVKKFNDSNIEVDGKKVNIDLTYLSDASTLQTRLITAKMNHELPDIIAVDAPEIARMAADEMIVPMEDYVDETKLADYVDSVIEQSTYNGHLYALSGMDAPVGLYYNKTALDSINKQPGTIENPWTWDDVEDAMTKLKAKGNVPYQIKLNRNFGAEAGAMYLYSGLVYSAGGDFVGADGKVTGHLNSDEAADGLGDYVSLYSQNGTQKWINTGNDNAFPSGEVAFEIHGPWLIKTIENYTAGMKDEWGIMPFPVHKFSDGTTGNICTPCGSWGFGISADCIESFKSSAAAVIEYLTGPEASLRFYNDINTFPTSKSVLQGEAFQTGAVKSLSDLLVETAKARPIMTNFGTLKNEYKNVLEAIEQDAGKTTFNLKTRLDQACLTIDNT